MESCLGPRTGMGMEMGRYFKINLGEEMHQDVEKRGGSGLHSGRIGNKANSINWLALFARDSHDPPQMFCLFFFCIEGKLNPKDIWISSPIVAQLYWKSIHQLSSLTKRSTHLSFFIMDKSFPEYLKPTMNLHLPR